MLIGFAGKAKAGKDTCADYLVAQYGFVKVALADPLKRFAMNVFSFTEAQLWGDTLKERRDVRYARGGNSWYDAIYRLDKWAKSEWVALSEAQQLQLDVWFLKLMREAHPDGISPREVLQLLGTEYGRTHLGENFWVNHLLDDVVAYLVENWYDRLTGLTYRDTHVVVPDVRFPNEIERIHDFGGVVWHVNRPACAAVASHSSETALDKAFDFDGYIDNSGTHDDLYARIEDVVDKVYWKCGNCATRWHTESSRCLCGAPRPSKPRMPLTDPVTVGPNDLPSAEHP